MENQRMVLVSLSGIDEKLKFLVPEDVFTWVESPPDFTQTGVYEVIPDIVRDYITRVDPHFPTFNVGGQATWLVTIGSGENDRAMALEAGSKLFYDTVSIMKYIDDNGIMEVDEYYGHIY